MINEFIEKFRSGKMSLEESEALLKQTKQMAKDAENEVYASVLGEFIKKGPKGPIEQGNGFEIFKRMFAKEGNEAQIDQVLSEIQRSNNPLAQKGAEAAYMAHLEDLIQTTENSKGFNTTAARKFLGDKSSLWNYGQKIFSMSGDPELAKNTIDTYRAIVGGRTLAALALAITSTKLSKSISVLSGIASYKAFFLSLMFLTP